MNFRDPLPPDSADGVPRDNSHTDTHWRIPGADWLSNLSGIWQYDDVAAEIGAESQSRVVIAGGLGVGKRTLFNRLRGWELDWHADRTTDRHNLNVESFGLFVLADLPDEADSDTIDTAIVRLGDPALIVYMLDATCAIDAPDLRWIAALRTSGKPMVFVLNKTENPDACLLLPDDLQQRLGAPIVPISAKTGLHVDDKLLPSMLDAVPRLAVPLAREIATLRCRAVRRLTRQSALFASLLGAQPFPMLEIPFLALVQVGLVMRIGAAYGRAPSGGVSREVATTVGAVIVLQYIAQTIIKFVPIVGSLVGAALSAAATFLIGESARHYYEAGAIIPRPTFPKTPTWRPRRWRRHR